MTNSCGADGTAQFDLFHPIGYLALIASSVIGEFDASSEEVAPQPTAKPTQEGVLSNSPSVLSPSLAPARSSTDSSSPTPHSTGTPSLLLSSKQVNDGIGINVSGISMADVEQHSNPSDCWSVYDDTVYDVTAYAPSHPGSKLSGGPNIDLM